VRAASVSSAGVATAAVRQRPAGVIDPQQAAEIVGQVEDWKRRRRRAPHPSQTGSRAASRANNCSSLMVRRRFFSAVSNHESPAAAMGHMVRDALRSAMLLTMRVLEAKLYRTGR
jgi:O-methyltransferase involved in polyketide biosynthesis